MQDLLDRTDALDVQARLCLDRTKMHECITDKLLLLGRHQPSIQCLGISSMVLIVPVPSAVNRCPPPQTASRPRTGVSDFAGLTAEFFTVASNAAVI